MKSLKVNHTSETRTITNYNTILSQIIAFIPRHDLDYHANIHHTGQKFRSHNRWSQSMAMMIGQLFGRKNLRDLTENLTVQQTRLYHLGMKPTAKSPLAKCMRVYGQRHSSSPRGLVPFLTEVLLPTIGAQV